MKTRSLLLSLLAASGALFGPSYARSGELQRISSLEDAKSKVPRSTQIACNADANEDLDQYGKNRIATGPISWALLRSISAITPTDSWAKIAFSNTGSLDSFSSIFNDYKVSQILKWMIWGVVSVAAGIFFCFCVLIACLCLIPLLWYCCGTCKDVDLRPRKSRVCNHIIFWICWILSLLFTFGLIYYSAWLRPDLNAAICKPIKISGDLLVDGINLDGYYFDSLADSNRTLQELRTSIDNAQSSNPEEVSFIASEALTEMWEPVSTFSSAWENVTFITQSNKVQATDFLLQLWGNLPVDGKVRYNALVNEQDANFSQVYNFPPLPNISWSDNAEVIAQLGEVGTAIDDAASYLDDTLSPAYIDFYNSLVDILQAVLNGKDGRENWAYALLLILSILPVFGVVAAFMLFVKYFRTSRSFTEQALSRWQHFVCFMIVGYAFWAVILFIGGGILLGISYFPSDACRLIDKILDGNDVGQYTDVLGTDVSQDVIDKCLRRDASGDIFSTWASNWNALDQQLDESSDLLTTNLSILDFSMTVNETAIQTRGYVVPIIPSSITNETVATIFLTGLEYQETPIDDALRTTLINNSNAWEQWFNDNHQGFGAIQDLQDILAASANTTGNDCNFCIDPYCIYSPGWRLSPENLMLPDFAEFEKFSATPASFNSTRLLELLAANSQEGTKTKLEQCGPSFGTDANLWWLRLYVLLYRSAALYERWSAMDNLSKLYESPLFFGLRSRQDPTEGSDPIPYSKWRNTVTDDVNSIIQFHHLPHFSQSLASATVRHSILGGLKTTYTNAMQNYDCRAVSMSIEDIKDAFCDSLSGDVASIATFSVWLAVLHLIAFIMCVMYWLPRHCLRYKLKEKSPDSDKSVRDSSHKIPHNGVTEAQFFHACEVGDAPTAKKAAQQYPPNSIIDLNYNNTPLHVAAYYGHVDITQELCEKGWDPNAFNFRRHTPFTACVSNLYLESDVKTKVMTILKDHGAWVDVYTGEGDTPLMIASRANEYDTVALLLEWNANPLKKDGEYHWSSVQLAEYENNQAVVELLKEASPQRRSRKSADRD